MHRPASELEERLDHILGSPSDSGTVEMIVVRPDVDRRREVEKARIDEGQGVVGDNWQERGSSSTPDGSANRLAQVTLMNSRVVDAVAGDSSRWPLAGDQLFVDLDLSPEALPAGTRVRVGSAVLEVSDKPHTGCAKFASRYGREALRFVNTGLGREKRFRGINAFVVQSGDVATGDEISKVG